MIRIDIINKLKKNTKLTKIVIIHAQSLNFLHQVMIKVCVKDAKLNCL